MMPAKIVHHVQRQIHSTEHRQAFQLCAICFRTSLKVFTHVPRLVISPGTPSPNFRISLC